MKTKFNLLFENLMDDLLEKSTDFGEEITYQYSLNGYEIIIYRLNTTEKSELYGFQIWDKQQKIYDSYSYEKKSGYDSIDHAVDVASEYVKEKLQNVVTEVVDSKSNLGILRVYDWNSANDTFNNLYMEIMNFKYKDLDDEFHKLVDDYTVDKTSFSVLDLEDGCAKKIDLIDKKTNQEIYSCYCNTVDVDTIIDAMEFSE